MTPDAIKQAFLTAQRAYQRTLKAKSCGLATNNFKLGQKQEQKARTALRELIPTKLEWRHYSQMQRHLSELQATLPNIEYNAHLHRLEQCGVGVLEHEYRAAADRIDKTDSARERQDRKRSKVRKPR